MKQIKFITNITLACIAVSTLNFSLQAFFLSSASAQESTVNHNRYLPESMVRDVARLITVRVYAINPKEWKDTTPYTIPISGSGILVDREEIKQNNSSIYRYLVLTNDHVSSVSEEFYIETPDGLIHKSFPHPTAKFEKGEIKADLGLLWFDSPYRYETAVIGKSTELKDNDDIFVVGFPCELTAVPIFCPATFLFTQGKVFVVDKPLEHGYQLAFNNETKEGTSGGAILNNQGKLVGINGRGKTSSDSPQNQYADGSGVPQVIKDNAPLALGLPIEWYSQLNRKELFTKIPPPRHQWQPFFDEKRNTIPSPITKPETPKEKGERYPKDFLFYIMVGFPVLLLLFILIQKYLYIKPVTIAEMTIDKTKKQIYFVLYNDQNAPSKRIVTFNELSSNPNPFPLKVRNTDIKILPISSSDNEIIEKAENLRITPKIHSRSFVIFNPKNYEIKKTDKKTDLQCHKYEIIKKDRSKKVQLKFEFRPLDKKKVLLEMPGMILTLLRTLLRYKGYNKQSENTPQPSPTTTPSTVQESPETPPTVVESNSPSPDLETNLQEETALITGPEGLEAGVPPETPLTVVESNSPSPDLKTNLQDIKVVITGPKGLEAGVIVIIGYDQNTYSTLTSRQALKNIQSLP